MIPFNKPFLTGKELEYVRKAVELGKISGDGFFSRKCQNFFSRKYGFFNSLLTTSCTDALEMAAILVDIKPGDEVIMPSFTFVSTANAFVLRGAKIVLCDSRPDHPGLDESSLRDLVTEKTKAIVVVHYAGVACDMDTILQIAEENNLYVVEDAAQAIDSFYISDGQSVPLGSFGHLSAFSFHETKNIISGEGGMLVVNDQKLMNRAEIVREKGTNRNRFFRGEVDKYSWVDIGSSFLPSDIIAAFLMAQLESMERIQAKRNRLWKRYWEQLEDLEGTYLKRAVIPAYATNNAHMFYVVCQSGSDRDGLMNYLKANDILAIFHYFPLHLSGYYLAHYSAKSLPCCEHYADCLLRLPLYYELEEAQVDLISSLISKYYKSVRPRSN